MAVQPGGPRVPSWPVLFILIRLALAQVGREGGKLEARDVGHGGVTFPTPCRWGSGTTYRSAPGVTLHFAGTAA
jgi:hypothetical protein